MNVWMLNSSVHNVTVYCTMTAMWYLFFWDSFILLNPLHWHRLQTAMWLVGVPKRNTELYIFHEPQGPNFMLPCTYLLPAKYQFWWARADLPVWWWHYWYWCQCWYAWHIKLQINCTVRDCMKRITVKKRERCAVFPYPIFMKVGFIARLF